ncbi:hypothetical protein R1sor_000225 [Riccia sorocarpa]|uniref:Replication factor A C-terminal domain-containing protein n=1 Tax=Riccia sorocarpa TaxID=122646 RepID=A0ABD3GSJ3_9MARC
MAIVTSLDELYRRMKAGNGYAVGTFPVRISRMGKDVIFNACPDCETEMKCEESGLFCHGSCKAVVSSTVPYYRLRVMINDSSGAHRAVAWKENAVTLLRKSSSEFQELCAAGKEKSVVDIMKRTLWVLKVEIANDKTQRGYLRIERVEKKQTLIPPVPTGPTSEQEESTPDSKSELVDDDLNDFTPISRRLFDKFKMSLTGNAIDNPVYSSSKINSCTGPERSRKRGKRATCVEAEGSVSRKTPQTDSHVTAASNEDQEQVEVTIHAKQTNRPDGGTSKVLLGCAAGICSVDAVGYADHPYNFHPQKLPKPDFKPRIVVSLVAFTVDISMGWTQGYKMVDLMSSLPFNLSLRVFFVRRIMAILKFLVLGVSLTLFAVCFSYSDSGCSRLCRSSIQLPSSKAAEA